MKANPSRIKRLIETAPMRINFVPEPTERKKAVATQLPESQHERLDRWAKTLGCRPSMLLAAAIMDAMDSEKVPE